jgi:hypothetical protein
VDNFFLDFHQKLQRGGAQNLLLIHELRSKVGNGMEVVAGAGHNLLIYTRNESRSVMEWKWGADSYIKSVLIYSQGQLSL